MEEEKEEGRMRRNLSLFVVFFAGGREEFIGSISLWMRVVGFNCSVDIILLMFNAHLLQWFTMGRVEVLLVLLTLDSNADGLKRMVKEEKSSTGDKRNIILF